MITQLQEEMPTAFPQIMGSLEVTPDFAALQKMKYNMPVAPFLKRPVAPFDNSESRKRAKTSAVYYGECFLKGISPKHADDAASQIEERYKKHIFKLKPKDHPKYFQNKIQNLNHNQFGYDAFGLKEKMHQKRLLRFMTLC